MADLPVRDLADVALAEALRAPGCPVCRRASGAETRILGAILDEMVSDVIFRQTLDAARGFCAGHARGLLRESRARSGSLSAAILLGASLRTRTRELSGAAAGGRSRARRAAAAAEAPRCPVCVEVATAVASAATTLVRHSSDPGWAEATAGARLCVTHLAHLMAVPRPPVAFRAVEETQLARLARLDERLDSFAHHSSEDRRHLLTDDERAAVDEAAEALG